MRYVLVLAFALAGCAAEVAGNSAGGMVEGGAAPASTPALFQKAEAHCARYGKQARVTGSVPQTVISYPTLSFDCVARS